MPLMAEFVWRKQEVDKRREHLSGLIEELSRAKPELPRVRLLMGMIVDGPGTEPEYQDLDRFVLILRCLIEHRKSGELRDIEITKLVELARTILLHSGIKPKTSKLSYLYENSSKLIKFLRLALGAIKLARLALHLDGAGFFASCPSCAPVFLLPDTSPYSIRKTCRRNYYCNYL
jgi:hypothetical protein